MAPPPSCSTSSEIASATTGAALPSPVSVAVNGEPGVAASCVTTTVPLRASATVGANCTSMVRDPPGARLKVPAPLTPLKSSPSMVISPVIVSSLLVFSRVSDAVAALPSVTTEKSSTSGVTVRAGGAPSSSVHPPPRGHAISASIPQNTGPGACTAEARSIWWRMSAFSVPVKVSVSRCEKLDPGCQVEGANRGGRSSPYAVRASVPPAKTAPLRRASNRASEGLG